MFSLLEKVCNPCGVSGDEGAAAIVCAEILSKLGETHITAVGSVICRLPVTDNSLPHIMLTAHLDRIGLIVTQITAKGYIKASPCGGVDRRTLAGARVFIHTDSGDISAVVGSTPPHLSTKIGSVLKVEDCIIDAGLSAEEAKSKINLGDRISFYSKITRLLGDRISAPALDDRAGCAAVIRAAELLKNCKTANISVALCSQEETTGAGAKTAAYTLNPDYAFAVDVSMGHTPDGKIEDCGLLGQGTMIGFSPVLDRALSKAFVKTATEHSIPFQYEIMAGRTGTDADSIAVARNGVKTGLLSIPLRFMHTPIEVISIADVENTAKLLVLQAGGDLC